MEDRVRLERTVKSTREDKALIKLFDINVTGRTKKEFGEIMVTAEHVLSGLEEKHEHFITKKYGELEDYLEVPYEELREHHQRGFRRLLLGEYRLGVQQQPSRIEDLKNEETIADLATAYTFDYVRTLTISKRMGLTPVQAMKLAYYSYTHNPNFVVTLQKQFPDADPWLITLSAMRYLKPEEHIQKALDLIPKLKEKYPEASIGLIKYAANAREDPEAFIEHVQGVRPKLKEKFPEAGDALINLASINYVQDPDSAIERALVVAKRLKEHFLEADMDMIKNVALGRPADPEKFVKKYLDRLKNLQSSHPDVGIAKLKKAAYSQNPEMALQKLLTRSETDESELDMEFEEHTAS